MHQVDICNLTKISVSQVINCFYKTNKHVYKNKGTLITMKTVNYSATSRRWALIVRIFCISFVLNITFVKHSIKMYSCLREE